MHKDLVRVSALCTVYSAYTLYVTHGDTMYTLPLFQLLVKEMLTLQYHKANNKNSQ